MSETKQNVEDAAGKVQGQVKAAGMRMTEETVAAAEQTVDKASELWQKTKDAGRHAGDVVSERYGRLSHGAKDVYSQGHDKAVEWEEDFEGCVRRNPLTAVLTGVGVGVLIGLALSTKK